MEIPFSPPDLAFGLFIALASVAIVAILGLYAPRAETFVIVIALLFKMMACLASAWIAVYYYDGDADMVSYHKDGVLNAELIRRDLSWGSLESQGKAPFFWIEGNTTSRFENLCGFVHFLLGDSFIAAAMAFSLLGFAGQYLLYRMFTESFPDPRLQVWWQIGLLFWPSLTFWSAGMLKDTMGIFGLGCAMWGLHCVTRRASLTGLVWFMVGLYILFLFRTHILPVLLIAALPCVLFNRSGNPGQRSSKGLSSHWMFRLTFVLGVVIILGLSATGLGDERVSLAELPEQIMQERQAYDNVEGTSNLASAPITSDASWAWLLAGGAQSLIIVLYRPFLFELTPSLLTVFAGLENAVVLILTLRMAGQLIGTKDCLNRALRCPLFVTCALFVAGFGLAIGASVNNLGSISRYRIPIIPFLAGLVSIVQGYTLRGKASEWPIAPEGATIRALAMRDAG